MSSANTPRLTNAQVGSAFGKVFDAPRVINGAGRVRFMGIWPTGNVAVKRETDPDSFGPFTVSPERARPLMEAIARKFNKRGYRAAIATPGAPPQSADDQTHE